MSDEFNILNPAITVYLNKIRPDSDSVLHEMEREGEERHFPYLGALCSEILFMLVKLTKARRIFELGSGFGYTMFWMAKALPEDGLVIGTEYDQSNVDKANEYFRRGGLSGKTELRKGNALEIFEQETGPFDLIFNDIDKQDYPRVIELSKTRLRSGGLLISDNVLANGRVTQPSPPEANTRAILEYNKLLSEDPMFCTTIIPIRDGLSVALKVG